MVEADMSVVKHLLFNTILLCLSSQGKGDYVLSKWEVDPTNALVSAQSFADSSLIQGKRGFIFL